MVDFNPAKNAIKYYASSTSIRHGQDVSWEGNVKTIKYRNYSDNLTISHIQKGSTVVDYDIDGRHYRLCDNDGDGNFDAVTIHSDKGNKIDYYLDENDDGTFDKHNYSDSQGNRYVEHRAKWYNPMTWFKHNE